MISWSDIHIRQVVKQYQGKHVLDVIRPMARGSLEAAQGLPEKSHGGTSSTPILSSA